MDSSHIADYPHPKWLQLAVSDAKVGSGCTQAQAYTKLRDAAQAEFDKGCDMPSVTLTVDFVNLFDTEEYKDYGFLQNIFLGDSVRVISKRLGLSVSIRIGQRHPPPLFIVPAARAAVKVKLPQAAVAASHLIQQVMRLGTQRVSPTLSDFLLNCAKKY